MRITPKYFSPSQIATAAIVLASVAFFTSQPAVAQDLSEEEMASFEAHLSEGGTLLDEEVFDRAIEELDQARQLIDHPRLSVSIAGAYLKWGRCAQAESEYSTLLERDDLDERQQTRSEQGLEDAKNDCVEMATLRVRCEPDDAELQIDGERHDCPFEDDVAVGNYQIEVSAEGFETHSESVAVEANSVADTEIALMVQEVDEPSTNWVPIASYSAVGAGALMLAGGGFLDYRAGARSTEIAEAQQEGDMARIEELEASASSARTANALLYVGGLSLVAGGVALLILDPGASESANDGSTFSLGLSPTGISTTLRW